MSTVTDPNNRPRRWAVILGVSMGTGAAITAVLDRAGLSISDIEWVLPHQPNGTMLELIIAAFGLDPARMVRVVGDIGIVASASIPVSLDRLLRTRPVRPGDRILMAGVGAGISHGAVLYRVGG
jgi:3-oxoacyl-[acyl-carrier-protein] synthase-3